MTPFENSEVRRVAVLADCHIHPGRGPDWTPAALAAIGDVDLIVTLGDMGEVAGLDRLAQIAPVIGVRGADDADDARTGESVRLLKLGGVAIGCVFDPKAHGLANASDPFEPSPKWLDKAAELFGERVQVLLYASTHRPHVATLDGVRVVNPGSALLPAEGAEAALAMLSVADGRAEVAIASVGA
jgi:putative phosphoesterase